MNTACLVSNDLDRIELSAALHRPPPQQESRSVISEERSAVLEEQLSQMKVQVEESRSWQSRIKSEREEREFELNRAREAAAARAAELELLKSQVS